VRSAGGWRTPVVVIVCGCLIALITYGLRTSFGLFVEPLSEGRGWSREVFALAIAIQNILWGLGQPVAGAIADRYGSARVLAVGGAIYALGVALMAVSTTPLALNLTAGVLVGLGLSGASFTIVIALFVTLPPSTLVVLAFAAAMGVLWLSTVPLTSGLVAVMFGTRYMGTLFRFVFLSHQVGAFLGVWLGGVAFEQTGSYAPVWWASVFLGVLAAALHWPIVERPAPAYAAAARTG
jgi:MFS family permease